MAMQTIPYLPVEHSLPNSVQNYLNALRVSDYAGDILLDAASLTVNATDNSIYQVMPQAVLQPKTLDDLKHLMKLAQAYDDLYFTPRGGGTGTNGQSLNNGIIVDCSRHLRGIIELNTDEGWVEVEPGVVLDQLNQFLKPHGLFFPPNLSPSNRATLGGMVATDASGKGSCVYGTTGDYVLSLDVVLADGQVLAITPEAATDHTLVDDVLEIGKPVQRHIQKAFPTMPRSMNGYKLHKVFADEGLNLCRLFAGSEGTLGLIGKIRLKVEPLPKHTQLILIGFDDFQAALRGGQSLLKLNPTAVETMDDNVMRLARQDAVWLTMQSLLKVTDDLQALNIVEVSSHDEKVVAKTTKQILAAVKKLKAVVDVQTTSDAKQMKDVWSLRKKCVGLLGNFEGVRRPLPFVEDTAVPPENLPDFIHDFRKILDDHKLQYGMFGHIDAGCLHVRPALDLTNLGDAKKIRKISDAVADLVKDYGGVLWGEHGKGYRGEYTEDLVGPKIFAAITKIKKRFDPDNKMNPGKVVVCPPATLIPLDKVSLRGDMDRQIPEDVRTAFAKSIQCNGNGACFDQENDDFMCPSYRASGDRRLSPKGRAALMREWLRQLSQSGYDIIKGKQVKSVESEKPDYDFSKQVYQAMDACLGCKACTSQCPVKVDIPDLKARFLYYYHTRYYRPLKDYVVGLSEGLAIHLTRVPQVANVLRNFALGLQDLPKMPTPTARHILEQQNITPIVDDMPPFNERSVILLVDALTYAYQPQLMQTARQFLKQYGYDVHITKPVVTGKGWHTKGFLNQFKKQARKTSNYLLGLAAHNVPIIALEASAAMAFRQDYKQHLEAHETNYHVYLWQEWLTKELRDKKLQLKANKRPQKNYRLFGHCTEMTSLPESKTQWADIFHAFGAQLDYVQTSCCGMAGSFGYEISHQDMSQTLYKQTWQAKIHADPKQAVVTGFSCRCQVARFSNMQVPHPVEVLLDLSK